MQKQILTVVALIGALIFGVPRIVSPAPALPDAAQAGADLTAEITLIPSVPDPEAATTIRIVVRNRGTSSATGLFFVYLYVDPATRPPQFNTPDTYFWQLTGLAAGGSFGLERTYTFTTTGCDHIVYVWVDRENRISETDETNNLVSTPVCVGVTCQPDSHEEDNTCSAAHWIGAEAIQHHTLCPVGDQDWIKFTATGGVTYTVAATNLGVHADPLVALYSSCSGLSQFGTGPRFDWYAPASGVYYAQVKNRTDTYGPLATYDLGVTAASAPADLYEPDDSCATARDIRTDGVRQSHLFQAIGDQDWVKFGVGSGETFSVVADNTGPGVSPLIALYSSCDQALAGPLAQGGQVQTAAGAGQTYYVKAINQNAAVYGPDARYDLAVRTIPCVADAFEEDDTRLTAREILPTGASQTHNTCPAGDEDWVHFAAEAGTTYVLSTANLGIAGDTVLTLYDTDGATELARNDDYGYLLSSRIIWQCPRSGVYTARVRHHNPVASGPDTRYDLAIQKGRCTPDAFEGDNGVLDAQPIATNGARQDRNFCPGANLAGVADQDWLRFDAVAGGRYLIETANLGPDSDTLLELYDRNGVTLLSTNDDHGPGRASSINFVAPAAGAYFVRVRPFNTSLASDDSRYQVGVTGAPPPSPTPSPTSTPSPTPTPRPTPPPGQVKTLILVNRQQMVSLYGAPAVEAMMEKLYQLADHVHVMGAVLQVEQTPSVAAAFAQWTANPTALLDVSLANAAASAVRNLALNFLSSAANVEYIVIVGNDRAIPHRRVAQGDLASKEHQYAPSVTADTPIWASVQNDMILTDDYYADREPVVWQGHEVYIPDYAIGRLIETPDEISAFIDPFLANDTLTVSRALVTGYHFVEDTAGYIGNDLFRYDGVSVDDTLVGQDWTGAAMRARHLNATPRFDMQSINGHASHTSEGTPDNQPIQAAEILTATADFSRSLIFTVGCHSGLNDSGVLDLAQAFAQKQANYVGNTAYGWGGDGKVYSEKLMYNFARELLRDTTANMGKALQAAKRRYYQTESMNFSAYDEAVLMESIFYGLPMYRVVTGGMLGSDNPFPSAAITTTSPSAFGGLGTGGLELGLPASFGAFSETTTSQGAFLALNDNISFGAGEPVQPRFYASLPASASGSLHGALFLGGVYTDVAHFDPVVALAFNEYITSTAEPAFAAPGWYPAVPFSVRSGAPISTTASTVIALLGQFDSAIGTERVYEHLSFATYFSSSSDAQPPAFSLVDGVLERTIGDRLDRMEGRLKVEATDPSGIQRIVVTYTDGQGVWRSQDLTHDTAAGKWTGAITATLQTQFMIQAVDGAGNVGIDDNKGQYRRFAPPVPFIVGRNLDRTYLPTLLKGG